MSPSHPLSRMLRSLLLCLSIGLAGGLAGCAGYGYYGGVGISYPYRYPGYYPYSPYGYYYSPRFRHYGYGGYRSWPRPYYRPWGGYRWYPHHHRRH